LKVKRDVAKGAEGVEIFVGGLPRSTSNEMLYDWFKQIAEPVEVCVARDKRRRRCRGYGHVRFRTSELASKAIDVMQNVQFKRGCFLGLLPSDENRTLYISGLDEKWHKDQITNFFQSTWDEIKSVQLVWERGNPTKLRPFCFVEFNSHVGALNAFKVSHGMDLDNASCDFKATKDAIEMDKLTDRLAFDGTQLKVEWADPLRYFIHLYGGVNRHTIQISSNNNVQQVTAHPTSSLENHQSFSLHTQSSSDRSSKTFQTAPLNQRVYPRKASTNQLPNSFVPRNDCVSGSWSSNMRQNHDVPRNSHFQDPNNMNNLTFEIPEKNLSEKKPPGYGDRQISQMLQKLQQETLASWKYEAYPQKCINLDRPWIQSPVLAVAHQNESLFYHDKVHFRTDHFHRREEYKVFPSSFSSGTRDVQVNSSYPSESEYMYHTVEQNRLPIRLNVENVCRKTNSNARKAASFTGLRDMYAAYPENNIFHDSRKYWEQPSSELNYLI
jgi:RNA recognition motif-containing protein